MAKVRLQGAKEKENGIYYEVDTASEPIGEGGMGKVYAGKAVNTKTGATRQVAIKFMFMELPDQAIERARRESSIQLRNDNLVEMLGFIETEEKRPNGEIVKHYHVVSELLHGVSLADILDGKATDSQGNEIPYARKLLNDFTKSPEHFAKTIIKAVLSGLMALHDAGYIHRDIDPSNIMITDDDKIKLIDFGICKQMNNLTTSDKNLTVANSFIGKPEYAAPELCLGDIKHHNQTTDIYSAGILLYQLIVGHTPFEGTRYQIVEKQVKEKLPLKDIKDKNLRRIIEKACEKRQEMRYQTCAEMRVDVENLDVKRAADPRRRRRLILIIMAFILLAGAAIFFFLRSKNASAVDNTELIEKHYTDSLTNAFNNNLKAARSLAETGYEHDENYDASLVKAKERFNAAEENARLLKEKDVATQNIAKEVARLDSALIQAHQELTDKKKFFESDSDPESAKVAESINARLLEIQKVIPADKKTAEDENPAKPDKGQAAPENSK